MSRTLPGPNRTFTASPSRTEPTQMVEMRHYTHFFVSRFRLYCLLLYLTFVFFCNQVLCFGPILSPFSILTALFPAAVTLDS